MKAFLTIAPSAVLTSVLSLTSAAPVAPRGGEALIDFYSATGEQYGFVELLGDVGTVPVETPFSVVRVAVSSGFDYCGLLGANDFYQAFQSGTTATIGPPQVITAVE